jgi:tagatose 6-phosphate kinase
VLTVTPNAGLDRTYLVDHFAVDRIHRPYETRVMAGGKGINVARVLKTLGGEAVATGFLGGHTGQEVRECLAAEGIRDAFVTVEGESRLCLKVLDTTARTQTEVNESGPVVSAEAQATFRERYRMILGEAAAVTLCGSLPPGVPPDFFRELIGMAKEHGVRTALDTSGEALRLAVEAKPDIVKPNAREVSELLGREIETVGEAAQAGRDLLRMGVQLAAITVGRCGAVIVDSTGAWFAEPPEVEFRSAVGCGDAFLAAMMLVLMDGRLPADALRYATAAGAANASTYGSGLVERHTVENLAPRVTVTPL